MRPLSLFQTRCTSPVHPTHETDCVLHFVCISNLRFSPCAAFGYFRCGCEGQGQADGQQTHSGQPIAEDAGPGVAKTRCAVLRVRRHDLSNRMSWRAHDPLAPAWSYTLSSLCTPLPPPPSPLVFRAFLPPSSPQNGYPRGTHPPFDLHGRTALPVSCFENCGIFPFEPRGGGLVTGAAPLSRPPAVDAPRAHADSPPPPCPT